MYFRYTAAEIKQLRNRKVAFIGDERDTDERLFALTTDKRIINIGHGSLLSGRMYTEHVFNHFPWNDALGQFPHYFTEAWDEEHQRIEYKWNEEHCGWTVEIGVRPFIATLSPEQELFANYATKVFRYASEKGAMRFPQTAPFVKQTVVGRRTRNWVRYAIKLRQTEAGDIFLMVGPHQCLVDEWKYKLMKRAIIHSNPNLVWFDRAPFVMLMESMAASYDHSVVQRYLFNYWIAHELCTWMS